MRDIENQSISVQNAIEVQLEILTQKEKELNTTFPEFRNTLESLQQKLSQFVASRSSPPKIVVLGLKGSGKTALIERQRENFQNQPLTLVEAPSWKHEEGGEQTLLQIQTQLKEVIETYQPDLLIFCVSKSKILQDSVQYVQDFKEILQLSDSLKDDLELSFSGRNFLNSFLVVLTKPDVSIPEYQNEDLGKVIETLHQNVSILGPYAISITSTVPEYTHNNHLSHILVQFFSSPEFNQTRENKLATQISRILAELSTITSQIENLQSTQDTLNEDNNEETQSTTETTIEGVSESQRLANSLDGFITKIRENVKNYKVPNYVVSEFIGELEKLSNELRDNETRKLHLIVVGKTGSCKTSLILNLAGLTPYEAKVRGLRIGSTFAETGKAVVIETPDATFIDTRGWRDTGKTNQFDDSSTAHLSIEKAIQGHVPDAIIYCVTAETALSEEITWDLEDLQKVQNCCQQIKGVSVPLLIAVTKMDNLVGLDRNEPSFNEEYISLSQYLINAVALKFGMLKPVDIIPCITRLIIDKRTRNQEGLTEGQEQEQGGVEEGEEQGEKKYRFDTSQTKDIEVLLGALSVEAPLQARINHYLFQHMDGVRRRVAERIIAIYSSLNAAISLLPLVDVLITWYTTENMCELLSIVSTSPERNYKSFKDHCRWMMALVTIVRSGFLFADSLFTLTGVFAVIGLVAGAGVGGASTYAIGRLAYNYYLNNSNTTLDELRIHYRRAQTRSQLRKAADQVPSDSSQNSTQVNSI